MKFFEIFERFFCFGHYSVVQGSESFWSEFDGNANVPHTLKCFLFIVPVEFQDTPEGT